MDKAGEKCAINQSVIAPQIDLDETSIFEGYSALSNIIRALIYRSFPEIYKPFHEKPDDFFMSPLLFAFFNDSNYKNDIAGIEGILNGTGYQTTRLKDDFFIVNTLPQLLRPYFFEAYGGKRLNEHPDFSIVTEYNHMARKGLDVIEAELSSFYKEFQLANKWLVIHDNPKIINFVSKSVQGLLSFWTRSDVTEVYFMAEYIHQGAHNIYNLFLHEKNRFFLQDPETLRMSEVSGNKHDPRTFMSAFHGIYTIAKRLEAFKILLEKDIYQGRLRHEFYGRYADELKRYIELGVYELPLRSLLTKEGIELFEMLWGVCQYYYDEDRDVFDFFDLSFRDVDFYYDDFVEHNSYEAFLNSPYSV